MSDLGVGDSAMPYLDVRPADITTVVTLTVTAPDGTTQQIPMGPGSLEPVDGTSPVQYAQRWTATTPLVYTMARRWLLHFDVDGTGQGAEDVVVMVAEPPAPGGPEWAPAYAQVAAYVPWLTVSDTVPGSQAYEGTFTDDTVPSPADAQRHIADAVNLVAPLVTVMPTSLYGLACTVTALYAAASLAAAYARTADEAARATALLSRATTAFARLEQAAQDAGVSADADEPILIACQPGWDTFYFNYL